MREWGIVMVIGLACFPACGDIDTSYEPQMPAMPDFEASFVEPTQNSSNDEETDEEVVLPPPRAVIRALPGELMFYGDTSSEGSLAPQWLEIENKTPSAVQLLDVYIVNDPFNGTANDAEYFDCALPHELPLLRRGETAGFEVSFSRSTRQRGAVLIVETTHPSYPTVEVPLSGKVFAGSF